jgi:hypothetical protein
VAFATNPYPIAWTPDLDVRGRLFAPTFKNAVIEVEPVLASFAHIPEMSFAILGPNVWAVVEPTRPNGQLFFRRIFAYACSFQALHDDLVVEGYAKLELQAFL